jgi:hypothetical protein
VEEVLHLAGLRRGAADEVLVLAADHHLARDGDLVKVLIANGAVQRRWRESMKAAGVSTVRGCSQQGNAVDNGWHRRDDAALAARRTSCRIRSAQS